MPIISKKTIKMNTFRLKGTRAEKCSIVGITTNFFKKRAFQQ